VLDACTARRRGGIQALGNEQASGCIAMPATGIAIPSPAICFFQFIFVSLTIREPGSF
jgi:hypothetical protein